MGKSHLIWVVVAILAAGALAPPPSSTVSEVAAALDRGDAQQAMSLSNAALKQEIGDPHTRAAPQEFVDEMGANESGAAGNEIGRHQKKCSAAAPRKPNSVSTFARLRRSYERLRRGFSGRQSFL